MMAKSRLGLILFLAAALASLSTPSFANGTGTGYLTTVNVEFSNGKFYTSTHTNAPTCASSGRWAVDVTTPQGQAMWSTVLLAYSLNKPVIVTGSGACDVWSDSETVTYLQIGS